MKRGYHMIARGGHARLRIPGLHAALELDRGHVAGHKAGSDVERFAQARILFEPILVVRLQPVDLAVTVDEIGHAAQD